MLRSYIYHFVGMLKSFVPYVHNDKYDRQGRVHEREWIFGADGKLVFVRFVSQYSSNILLLNFAYVLGGHAKTLMFVQLNPDATSYSETLSTLKFAERVSGVELGAAKSNKDNREVRELMEQVTWNYYGFFAKTYA